MGYPTREEWHNAYIYELKDLYYIIIDILKNEYKLKYINDEIAFHNFSRWVYNDSSKYISPYTEANCT